MLRSLLLAACLLLVAGCASPAAPVEPPAAETAPPAAEVESLAFEGRYSSLVVNGESMQSDGGVHEIQVAEGGWTEVLVRLDIQISAALLLMPPGCGDATCALRFDSPSGKTDILAEIPAMAPGTWTTAMEQDNGMYAGSVYTLTFDYVQA